MTRGHRGRWTLGALALASLCASGCELFAAAEPCAPGNHAECAAGERCGDDGFCGPAAGPADDAGRPHDAGRPDAGDTDDDAGAPRDAALPEDAGRVDGGGAGDDAGAPGDDGGTPLDAGDGGGADGGRDGGADAGFDAAQPDRCGDGEVDDGEECDDGVDNSDTEPDACRTDCTNARCGDGVIDADAERGESCDGAALGAFYCLERGALPSPTASCNASCDGLDVTTCGAPIADATTLAAALLAAYERDAPSVVALQEGTFSVDQTLVLEDTVDAAHPIVLRPLGDAAVALAPASGLTGPLLRVLGDDNRVERLRFADAARAVELAGERNVVERCFFVNGIDAFPVELLLVSGDHNVVHHNRFLNGSGAQSGRALSATTERGLIIARNLFHGTANGQYAEAVRVVGTDEAPNRVTRIAHNSIDVTGNMTAFHLENTGELCFFNNVVRGNNPTHGLELAGTVDLGNAQTCGADSADNSLSGMSQACSGELCASLCASSGPLCDRTDTPGFDTGGCLSTSSGLIDAAADVGFPPVGADGAALPYTGAAPDVGAREAGTTTAWADVVSTCPAP